MPNPEGTEEQTQTASLTPDEIRKAAGEGTQQVLDAQKVKEKVEKLFYSKAANLSEEGEKQYYAHVEHVKPEEGETWEDAFAKKDAILKTLEATYPKEAAPDPDAPPVEKTPAATATKEPMTHETGIRVEKPPEDGLNMPIEAVHFSSIDEYVKNHNNKYKAIKTIDRYSKQLSVDN